MGVFDSLAQGWDSLKNTVTGAVQPAVDSAVQQTGTQSIATTPGAQQTLGTAPEAPGTNMVGGKRRRREQLKNLRNLRKLLNANINFQV